jgi:tRNA-Thr(GGU) m(6)t(6)A37 methyltransferase TsaA
MDHPSALLLRSIGQVRSTLRALEQAPRQGFEGAPDAWLDINADFAPALIGIQTGDALIVITWLHRAGRDVLQTHPRNDPTTPLTGVFATRSPDRPNPLGLHRVTVREIVGTQLLVGPIEAIDGTPIVDVKAVIDDLIV